MKNNYLDVMVTEALSDWTSHIWSNCATVSPTFTNHSLTVTSFMPSPMSESRNWTTSPREGTVVCRGRRRLNGIVSAAESEGGGRSGAVDLWIREEVAEVDTVEEAEDDDDAVLARTESPLDRADEEALSAGTISRGLILSRERSWWRR